MPLKDGAITRLGILECPRASDSYVHGQEAEATFTRRLMWDDISYITAIRSAFPSALLSSPPTATALPLATMESTVGKPTGDLTPHTLLLWARNSEEIAKVGRVSLRVRTGGDGTEQGNTVFGMRVEFVRRYGQPNLHVGHRKSDSYGNLKDWPDDQMVHLDIDGDGGEIISEVAVATADCPRAIMVRGLSNPSSRRGS